MKDCQECDLHKARTQIVWGTGSTNPLFMFIAEAPGETEDEKGIPLIGKAGEKFNAMLKYADIERSECYISNSVLCRPPGNRNPKIDELDACRDRLIKEIELVNPRSMRS
jgi:DNA polymerase